MHLCLGTRTFLNIRLRSCSSVKPNIVVWETAMDVDSKAASIQQENRGRPTSEKWSDGTKLLCQPGYLKVLKQFALSGEMFKFEIRSVCWKLFLGCIPEQQSQWKEASEKNRRHYGDLLKQHLLDPHNLSLSLDVAVNNPLSQDSDSPWHKYFMDGELKQSINQDITRTFPEVPFFRQQDIQDTMLQILFCYAKEHPDVEYRQGMHELLAPILFVLHTEQRDVDRDETLSPEMKVVMDTAYIEHDAYCLFSELMDIMQSWYMQTQAEINYQAMAQRAGGKTMVHDPRNQKPFEEKNEFAPSSPINRKLEVIHEVLLKKTDNTLYLHLKALNIPMQAYGIRWLRLLFSREFGFISLLELWDALFADRTLIDYFFVVMLINIRDSLLSNDYTTAMQALMTYPHVEQVNHLVMKALHLKSPAQFPVMLLDRDPEVLGPVFPPLPITTPPPAHDVTTPTAGTKGNKGVGGIIQALAKGRSKADNQGGTQATHEMFSHFKSKQYKEGSDNEDSLEGKCDYCGQKMDAIVAVLQDEVTRLTNLNKEAEQNILVSVAGLKQIRDLLLNKIPFSSDLCNWATEKESFNDTIYTRSPTSYTQDHQEAQHRDLEQLADSAHYSLKEDKEEITISPVAPNNAHPLASGGAGVAGSSSDEWCEVQPHPINA